MRIYLNHFLKNLKNISIKQINDLFGNMNIEKDKELKIMSNHFLKKKIINLFKIKIILLK